MTQSAFEGYVVVALEPDYLSDLNPRYMGIDRIPAYPSSVPEELPILDDYVFGGYKDLSQT
jgi:hypothetical protein